MALMALSSERTDDAIAKVLDLQTDRRIHAVRIRRCAIPRVRTRREAGAQVARLPLRAVDPVARRGAWPAHAFSTNFGDAALIVGCALTETTPFFACEPFRADHKPAAHILGRAELLIEAHGT